MATFLQCIPYIKFHWISKPLTNNGSIIDTIPLVTAPHLDDIGIVPWESHQVNLFLQFFGKDSQVYMQRRPHEAMDLACH